jgi:hypothetical protein
VSNGFESVFIIRTGVGSYFSLYVSFNDSGSENTIGYINKNGSNSSLLVNIAGSTTGRFGDVVNTVSFAIGDFISAFFYGAADAPGIVSISSLNLIVEETVSAAALVDVMRGGGLGVPFPR